MRVLVVEPFYGGSHRQFADGLRAHSRHDIELLTLPEGEWRRRMRRGAVELASASKGVPGTFDEVLTTDMLDLAAFLTLTRPRFSRVPVLHYFHENQFTYPRIRGTKLNSWFGQINWLSALAADRVAFNSDYHRRDFFGALRTLAETPNNWLVPESTAVIEAKSDVLPVGVDLASLDQHRPSHPVRREWALILWNHRWEFDKSPDMFARVIERLAAAGRPFELALLGEPGPNPHPALHRLLTEMPERIAWSGFLPTRADYARVLWESDVVVSTTRHEFFGVGMVEALHCECVPCAPAAFTYPDLIPASMHEARLFGSEAEFEQKLESLLSAPPPTARLREGVARFAWPAVARQWDEALDRLRDEFATTPST